MSDIVERLLKQAAICRDSKTIGLITKRRSEVAMFEAADTITNLRAEQSSFYAKGWNDAMAAAAELNTAELAEARAKAFEEAAKVAEGEKCSDAIVAAENIAGSGDAWLVNHICDEIAQSIRAIINKG